MASALVVIDLQNDFAEIVNDAFIANLTELVAAARRLRHVVIWVRSEYQTPADAEGQRAAPTPHDDMDAMTHATHTGAKVFCKKGTPGAQFIAPVEAMIDNERDVRVKKTFYSAFTETVLEKELRKRNVEKLYVCGVTSTTCVKTTTFHGCKLGFDVRVCIDVVRGFSKGARHSEALSRMAGFGATLMDNAAALDAMRTFGCGAKLLHDVIPPDVLDLDFDRLRHEIRWCEMLSHGAPVPRLVACQGTVDPALPGVLPLYRHPVDLQPLLVPWTPSVQRIRDYVANVTGLNINHALIQLYRDGADCIGEHSDKTIDIVPGTAILNFSIGATRNMHIAKKRAPSSGAEVVPLDHNSLFVFDLVTNGDTRHEIRCNKRPLRERTADELRCDGARISFTFRVIGTFLDTTTGRVIGQGARKDGNFDVDDKAELHRAMSRENAATFAEFASENLYESGFNALYVTTMGRSFSLPRELSADEAAAAADARLPQLHFVSGSVPNWRVEFLLHELGVAYRRRREKVMVRLSDKLGQLSARQLTPTFIDSDGVVVRESFAIIHYLCQTRGATAAFFPADPVSAAQALEFAHAAEDLLRKRFSPLEGLLLKRAADATDAEVAAIGPGILSRLEEELRWWDTRVLGSRAKLARERLIPKGDDATASLPFLVGDRVTVADISFLPTVAFLHHRGVTFEAFPNIDAYFTAHSTRPSFLAARPEGWTVGKVGQPNLLQRLATRVGRHMKAVAAGDAAAAARAAPGATEQDAPTVDERENGTGDVAMEIDLGEIDLDDDK